MARFLCYSTLPTRTNFFTLDITILIYINFEFSWTTGRKEGIQAFNKTLAFLLASAPRFGSIAKVRSFTLFPYSPYTIKFIHQGCLWVRSKYVMLFQEHLSLTMCCVIVNYFSLSPSVYFDYEFLPEESLTRQSNLRQDQDLFPAASWLKSQGAPHSRPKKSRVLCQLSFSQRIVRQIYILHNFPPQIPSEGTGFNLNALHLLVIQRVPGQRERKRKVF